LSTAVLDRTVIIPAFDRDAEIRKMRLLGNSSRSIADEVGCSHETVRTVINRITKKEGHP